jgi:hypothetical protein
MAESDLSRWGGLAAMGSGILGIILYGLLALALGRGLEEFGALDILIILGYVLILVGLLGFHILQGRNYGRIGRAGLYTSIGSILVLFLWLVASLLAGTAVLVVLNIVGALGLLVGLTLYGAATLQARVLPRWCGILFIILMPGAILLASLLWQWEPMWSGLVWLALGYGLWSQRSATAEQPSRVR